LLPVENDYRDQGLQSVIRGQAPPVFGETCEDLPARASALGLNQRDLTRLPAQAVSTDASHLLVCVQDRAAVERACPNAAHLAGILAEASAQGCYLFSLDPVSPLAMAHARFFHPSVGLFEDSATGSAAGPLACQLIALGVAKENTTITIEPGYEMARPSLLKVHVRGDSMRLSGRCVKVAEGALRVR
jgi:trans-2,3-dihydro-3-hydroxyanthranilate isomerase